MSSLTHTKMNLVLKKYRPILGIPLGLRPRHHHVPINIPDVGATPDSHWACGTSSCSVHAACDWPAQLAAWRSSECQSAIRCFLCVTNLWDVWRVVFFQLLDWPHPGCSFSSVPFKHGSRIGTNPQHGRNTLLNCVTSGLQRLATFWSGLASLKRLGTAGRHYIRVNISKLREHK